MMTNLVQRVEEKTIKQIMRQRRNFKEKKVLPGGESNPGLPRDRRGYSPLYYRGTRMESDGCYERKAFWGAVG